MNALVHRTFLLVAITVGLIGVGAATFALAQEETPAETSDATPEPTATATLAPTVAALLTTPEPTATVPPTATPEPTASPTPVPPPARTDDPTAVPLDPPMAFLIVLALLVLAMFAVARLFTYLTESREDYYATVREFARKGVFFTPVLVSPTTGGAALPTDEAVATTTSFEVAGPGVIAPGQPAVFSALRNGVPAANAVWEIQAAGGEAPADSVSLAGTPGSTVTVTAHKRGTFVLVALLAGTPETPDLAIRTLVTVLEPPVAGDALPDLPFIGQGFGSIISAIVIVAALVVLAATRAIDAEVVGVVLGALAGYLFGVGVASRT